MQKNSSLSNIYFGSLLFMNLPKNLYLFLKKCKNYAEIPIAAEAQTNFFGLPMI